MHDTSRTILRAYALCAIWLAVTLGIGFAALGPVDVVLSAIDASAIVKGATAMAIGVVTGSLVAWLLWTSFPVRGTRPSAADQRELAPATVLGSTIR